MHLLCPQVVDISLRVEVYSQCEVDNIVARGRKHKLVKLKVQGGYFCPLLRRVPV